MRTKSVLIAIVIFSIFLFRSTFNLYFVQDDFLFLSDTQISSLHQFLEFFVPRSDVVWYRPLSTQVFFYFGQLLFGLNPLPYHILVFATHVINIFLIFRVTHLLTNKSKTSLIAALVYGLNAHHFIALAWASNYSFVLGPTFILFTIDSYIQKKYTRAVIAFFLGILTTEMVIFTLGPLLVWEFFHGKQFIKKLLPYALLTGILFVCRRVFFPAVSEGVHALSIRTTILSLSKFYLLRINGFNLFESSIDNGLTLLLFAIWGVLFIPIIKLVLNWRRSKVLSGTKETIVFCIATILSFLMLFLLLPQHFSVHYLTFSIIGFSILVAVLVSNSNKFIVISFLGLYVLLQLIVVNETYKTHWIVRRANLAKRLVQKHTLVYPVGSEEYFALGANKANSIFNK